jgi:hypothetical protein
MNFETIPDELFGNIIRLEIYMANKKLTIKGITFPNFGKDDRKKNFRLVFHVGYTDANGDEGVAVVSKPAERHWQWRNPNKDAFLKPTIVGSSVTLDTLVLKNGDGGKIPPLSNKIADIDGTITDVSIQFMDVHDTTAVDFFIKSVLPQLITAWKASGINPVDLVPVSIPGGIKTIIKEKIDFEKLVDSSATFFTKKLKDKVLHSISQEYKDDNPLILSEDNVPWGDAGKTGTYGVTIGIV